MFPGLEFVEFQRLVDRKVIRLKNEEKNEKRSMEFAMLIWFVFSLVILPTILCAYLFVEDVISADFVQAFKAFMFLVFFAVMEAILFIGGLEYYSYSKNPSYVFWKYFIKGKLNLVFVGPYEIDGTEYVLNEFMSKSLNYTQPTFLLSVNIRKDIHQKAMDLNKKVYDIAFDKHGNRKFVSMDGVIEDADEDVILVARFINALYALYGDDIHQLKIETDAETRRREQS